MMTGPTSLDRGAALRFPLGKLRQSAYGFLYWVAFLLVLEPDNVIRAIGSGHGLAFGHEMLRIVVASLLGASVTPLPLWLTRHYPILGPHRLRHVLLHVAATAGLGFGLIVASCFLAAWLFERQWLPSITEIHDQLVSNGPLLVYAIAAFTGIAHAVHYFREAAVTQEPTIAGTRLKQIPVKTRGRLTFLNPTEVDWIETRGNYLALHVGTATHLIRETLQKIEAQLCAEDFVRIHRRMIVAVDRIQALEPGSNGDAILRLSDGCELRSSRRYREVIRQKWPKANRQ
jgi:hypothetical protein